MKTNKISNQTVSSYIKKTAVSSFHWQQMDKVGQGCLLTHIHKQQKINTKNKQEKFTQIQSPWLIKWKYTGLLNRRNLIHKNKDNSFCGDKPD